MEIEAYLTWSANKLLREDQNIRKFVKVISIKTDLLAYYFIYISIPIIV